MNQRLAEVVQEAPPMAARLQGHPVVRVVTVNSRHFSLARTLLLAAAIAFACIVLGAMAYRHRRGDLSD
jgi:hypothetical protein